MTVYQGPRSEVPGSALEGDDAGVTAMEAWEIYMLSSCCLHVAGSPLEGSDQPNDAPNNLRNQIDASQVFVGSALEGDDAGVTAIKPQRHTWCPIGLSQQ
jgi:hypothetical protein